MRNEDDRETEVSRCDGNVSQNSDDSTDQRRENNELSGKFDSDIDISANHNRNTPENLK